MSDNQSENSSDWGVRPTKPWPNPPASTPEELARKARAEAHRKIYDATHHISEISALPTDARYFALYQESITYDDGYGERGESSVSTRKYIGVVYFDTDEALEAWVLQAVEQRKTYRIIRAEPVKTEVKAVFSIAK